VTVESACAAAAGFAELRFRTGALTLAGRPRTLRVSGKLHLVIMSGWRSYD
jgi:hypothetical protein